MAPVAGIGARTRSSHIQCSSDVTTYGLPGDGVLEFARERSRRSAHDAATRIRQLEVSHVWDWHFPELLIVLVIALIVFGPGKLPEIGRSIGQGIRYFRQSTSELERTFSGAFEDPIVPPPPSTTGTMAAPAAGTTLEPTYPVTEPVPAAGPTTAAEPPTFVHTAPVMPEVSAPPVNAQHEHAPVPETEHGHTPPVPEPVAHEVHQPEAPATVGVSAGAALERPVEPVGGHVLEGQPVDGTAEAAASVVPLPRQRTRRVRKTAAVAANDSSSGTGEGIVAVAEKPSSQDPSGESAG